MGLRQEDPLSSFLFLHVAKGLSGLMKNATQLRKFLGFQLNEEVHFELLQFADDTILSSDGSWNNLWTNKAILTGFELVLGLYVNLCKRELININLKDDFMQVASSFLSYSIGQIPFKFLSTPVEANSRKRDY